MSSDKNRLLGDDQKRQQSYYQRFSRFYGSELSFYAFFLKCFHAITMQKNLPGFRIPTTQDTSRRLMHLMQNIADGSALITETLWPAVFFALLASDLYHYYTSPDDRYGVTLQDILLGTANNKNGPSLSSNLGTDIPGEEYYLLGPAIMFGAWMLSMAGYMLYRRSWHSTTSLSSSVNYTPYAAASLLLDDQQHPGSLNDDDSLILQLYSAVQDASIQPVFRVGLLSKLVKQLDPKTLSKLNLNHADDYDEIHKNAVKTLRETAKFPTLTLRIHVYLAKLFGALYARYELWASGESQFRIGHPLFFLVPLFTLYAKLRFFELIALKSYRYWEFDQEACDCITAGLAWNYIDMAGQYLCTVCGDWDFVSLRDMNNTQSCVDVLFQQPLTSNSMVEGLQRFNQHSGVQALDLGAMRWHELAPDALEVLVNGLLATVVSTVQNMSFALPEYADDIPDRVVNAVSRLLPAAPLRHLNLQNVGLTAEQIATVLSSVTTQLDTLDLNGMQLGDAEFTAVFNHTAVLTALMVLNIGQNQLSDFVMSQLRAIPFRQLQELNIAYNAFGTAAVVYIADMITTLPLRLLNISGNPMPAISSESLANGVTNSSLQTLVMNDVQLDDEGLMLMAMAIANSSVLAWHVMHNAVSVSAIQEMMSYLANSSLAVLNMANNPVGSDGFSAIVSELNKSAIRTLQLSNIAFDGSGLDAFKNLTLTNTQLTLDLSDNPIDDAALSALATWIQRQGLLLSSLAISSIAATEHGLVTLIQALPDTLSRLDLSRNFFGEAAVAAIVEFLQDNTGLSVLRIDDIAMTPEQMSNLSAVLRNTSLKELYVNSNPIGDAAAFDLAQYLIQPGLLHASQLGNAELPRDMMHAFYDDVMPATALEVVSLNDANISSWGATALCRVSQFLLGLQSLSMMDNNAHVAKAADCAYVVGGDVDAVLHADLALSQQCDSDRDHLALYILVSAFASLFVTALTLTACGPRLSKVTSLFRCKACDSGMRKQTSVYHVI